VLDVGQMNIRITRKAGVAYSKNRCQSLIVSNIREYCALTPIFDYFCRKKHLPRRSGCVFQPDNSIT